MKPKPNPIVKPFKQRSSVLKHHEVGPGTRWVFMQGDMVPGAEIYQIVRRVEGVAAPPEPYIDSHKHTVPSLYSFIGIDDDLTGLEAEVTLDGTSYVVSSPGSVYIPAETMHTYRILSGTGFFVHTVCHANYDDSLGEH